MSKLLEEFPPVSTEQWESAIGAGLIWKTDDGIEVKPYYRSDDLAGLPPEAAAQGANEWEMRDDAEAPSARVIVDAAKWEESGATTVQELAFALAEGIALQAEDASREVGFSLAIGSSYFFQIAKLRALRRMWAQVLEAFGIGERKLWIQCRTSRWNKSVYDAHVNILRATTEAMSAAIGGADSIAVLPFDETYREPGEASRRLARNTQLILKHEAHLDRTADPAAGSYYVEALTDALAKAAWQRMQEIEASGGYGEIMAEIAESRAAKETAIAHRKRVFIGVNQYPNPDERMLEKIEAGAGLRRGPEVFEAIRLRTERSGKRPKFLLAEIGDVKMRAARSQFAADFFGCAGFAIEIRTFKNITELANAQADAIVLCSSDAEYPALLEQLKTSIPVIVAGVCPAAECVNSRSNAAAVLQAWQDRLGVKS